MQAASPTCLLNMVEYAWLREGLPTSERYNRLNRSCLKKFLPV